MAGIRPTADGQVAGSTFTQRRRFGRFSVTGSCGTGWSRREGAPGGVDFAPFELEAVNRAAELGLTGEVAAAACRRGAGRRLGSRVRRARPWPRAVYGRGAATVWHARHGRCRRPAKEPPAGSPAAALVAGPRWALAGRASGPAGRVGSTGSAQSGRIGFFLFF
jgi:hypothetical protein